MTFPRPHEHDSKTAEPEDAALASISSRKLFPRQNVLTVQQVADALCLTKQHVINLIDTGALRRHRRGRWGAQKGAAGATIGIPVSAYDAFIQQRKF